MSLQLSVRHKCIFIHVPKTGGMAIEETHIFDDARYIVGGPVSGHVAAAAIRDRLGPAAWNEFFTFGFVRNPLDRFASAFTYLARGGTNAADRQIRDQLIAPLNGDFTKFVYLMERANLWLQLVHFIPQWCFLCEDGGKVIVDFVGRFENLAADFHYVCGRLGIPRFDPPVVNASGVKSYADLYTPETAAIVAKHYAADIALFGLPSTCSE